MPYQRDLPEEDHRRASPEVAGPACRLPATLPGGRPWPRIAAVVVGSGASAATFASLRDQGYPNVAGIHASDPGDVPAALDRDTGQTRPDFILVLRASDRLTPGALAALALAADLDGADAVAGMRIVTDRGDPAHLDVIASPAGALAEVDARTAIRRDAAAAPFRGGEILLRASAVERAGGFTPGQDDPVADLWPRLARAGSRLAVIGRPVLSQEEPGARGLPPPPALRIAALNDSGPEGGAGIAHRRLADTLRLAGHRVSQHRLDREAAPVAAEWTDTFPATEAAILAEQPDLILAGNIHGATRSPAVLARLHAHAPVAAVLHDLFLLTGRCAHPDPGNRLAAGCDALCPTPTLYPQLDPARIAGAYAAKRSFLAGSPPPLLLANSSWTAERARDLAPAGARIARIDLGFPTSVFRPGDKAELRRRLGLSPTDILILFGAVITDQPSKGGADLVAALSRVARPGIGFVALGRIDDPGSFPLPNLTAPGPIGDEAELAAWYGACDLHVTASRLETLGQTPIEAGLCGLPTVAYRSTGLTTAVIDGVSGVLVEPDPAALAEAVRQLAGNPGRLADLSAWGRIALGNRNSQAAAYLGLHAALVRLGLQPAPATSGRIRFGADALAAFGIDERARPSGSGRTVAPPARLAVRTARRLKQRIWGRAQPLWMRRALYAGHLLRREADRLLGRR